MTDSLTFSFSLFKDELDRTSIFKSLNNLVYSNLLPEWG